MPGERQTAGAAIELYLDLLKRCLLNLIYQDPAIRQPWDDSSDREYVPFDRDKRLAGLDWRSQAHTQIGMRRLDNLHALVTKVLVTETQGDLIETVVWRGGSTILMRGILRAHGITDRAVWVADSFEGFPTTEEQGASARSFSSPELAAVRGYFQGALEASEPALRTSLDHMMQGASLEDVRDRFDRYGLLDDQVKFLRGWFRDTLPSAPIERLALLRLDGDLYDSTYDALDALYPRLSVGGYTIVDDYGWVEECRRAVHDYLDAHRIQVAVHRVDDEAVYWQKQS
jgi:O-methyltransferase